MTLNDACLLPPSTRTSYRVSGFVLIAVAACEVLFMAMHPVSSAHNVASFATEASRGVPGNAMVHGVLITLLLVMSAAFITFAQALGTQRMLVRTGLIAWLAGSACGILAGLINGFIVPATAGAFAGADPATTSALGPVLRLCRVANGVFARADVVWASAGILLWSLSLLRCRGLPLLAGTIGLCCSAVPLGLLASGQLAMNVRGFGTFVLLQAVFAGVAGLVLVRTPMQRKPHEGRSSP